MEIEHSLEERLLAARAGALKALDGGTEHEALAAGARRRCRSLLELEQERTRLEARVWKDAQQNG